MGLLNYLKYSKYVPRILYNKGSTPLYFILFVTAKCNLRCAHCFYWQELNKVENELSLYEIKETSKKMDDLLFLRITGGEPFLRRDVPEIAKAFYENNSTRNFGVNTNGFLTDFIIEETKRLLLYCPDAYVDLCFSLDGPEKIHDQIRGKEGAFKNAVKSLERANELREKFPKLKTVVGINVNADNQDHLEELFEIVSSKKPSYICNTLVRAEPKKEGIKNVDLKNYHKLVETVRKYNAGFEHQSYIDINAKDQLVAEMVSTARDKKKWWGVNCVACDKSAVMYSNGDVYPCELWSQKVGNIRDYKFEFKDLWKNERAREVRKKIKKDHCFCSHESFITANILLNPQSYPRLAMKTLKSSKP